MNVVKIPLTKNKEALIDSRDSHLLNFKWCFFKPCYAVRNIYFGKGKSKTTFLHHCIVGYPLNGLQIDHINGDGLDNRHSNLRLVTRRENHWNRKIHRGEKSNEKKKTSKFVGVNLANKKWKATISINAKSKHLGYFESEIEAAEAYLNYVASIK